MPTVSPVSASTLQRRGQRAAAHLTFWGARGSIPSPGPDTVKFGGNTTCAELRADGEHIILDAGTGLRALGSALVEETKGKPLRLTLLLTHLHWDHIQGFPFFAPAYQPGNRIRVLGQEGTMRGLEKTLAVQMESPYFPISFSDLPGTVTVEQIESTTFLVGSVLVRTAQTRHPGHTIGYRLETSGGSVCFVPDHESAPGETHEGVSALIAGADVLMMDAQYTVEEYAQKKGWGHGCLDDVVRVAGEAGVKRLYLFHHDPAHDDAKIEQMVARAREISCAYEMEVDAAREGEQVVLRTKGG